MPYGPVPGPVRARMAGEIHSWCRCGVKPLPSPGFRIDEPAGACALPPQFRSLALKDQVFPACAAASIAIQGLLSTDPPELRAWSSQNTPFSPSNLPQICKSTDIPLTRSISDGTGAGP